MKRYLLLAAIGLGLPSVALAAHVAAGGDCCPGWCCIFGCPLC